MTCVDGDCVRVGQIEKNSSQCKPDCAIRYEITDHWSGLESVIELIVYLYDKFTEAPTPGDALFVPPEIDIDVDVYVPNDDRISGVYLDCSEPLGQFCNYMDLLKPDKNRFKLTRVGMGHYRNLKPIRHCSNPLVDLVAWAIDKLCGGCLNANLPTDLPSISASISVIYEDGTILTESIGKLPTWYDAIWRVVEKDDYSVFVGQSPIDLAIVDDGGRKVGAIYENGVFVGEINEISGSFYTGRNSSPEIILLPFSPGEYKVYVNGTESGAYDLTTISIKDGKVDSETDSKQISEKETHTYIKEISRTGKVGKPGDISSNYILLFAAIVMILLLTYIGRNRYRGITQQREHGLKKSMKKFIWRMKNLPLKN